MFILVCFVDTGRFILLVWIYSHIIRDRRGGWVSGAMDPIRMKKRLAASRRGLQASFA